jgi:hypothetical protein
MRLIFFAVFGCILLVASPVPPFEPPKLSKVSPNFWATGVSPATKVVTVSFDQTMRSGFWDCLGRNVLGPPTNYEVDMGADLKSYSLHVRLEPGKVYIMGLNERALSGVGFQNEKGISMRPAYLVFQTSGNVTPEDAPPKIVATAPAHGAREVDAQTTKVITVTFDKPMETKKHGFHLLENKQPVDLKRMNFIYSADGKTFTLHYPLKSSTTYEVEINNNQDIGFAATNRVPLWPHRFDFVTSQPR